MLFLWILAIIGAIILFGPTVAALVGSFFSWIIFIALAVLSLPFGIFLNWKDNKEMNSLIGQIDEALFKNDTFRYLTLKEKYSELEERVHRKTSIVVWTLVSICIILCTIKLAIII